VDYVIGLHVRPSADVGSIELKYGTLTANADKVNLCVKGKTGHGASPETAVDAIYIAGNVITSLQSLVSRNISPLNSAVFSIGTIQGGTKNNIIADRVTMAGTLRTFDATTRALAQDRIKCISENVARSFGGECEVEIISGNKSLKNDDGIVDLIKDNAEKIWGKDQVSFTEFPTMAGEDFSYYLDEAKGAFFHIGCGKRAKGITEELHNKNFVADENCIKVGLRLQLENVLSLLLKNKGYPATAFSADSPIGFSVG
jgi:amidohydrolase